jgi:hypothetical protein
MGLEPTNEELELETFLSDLCKENREFKQEFVKIYHNLVVDVPHRVHQGTT